MEENDVSFYSTYSWNPRNGAARRSRPCAASSPRVFSAREANRVSVRMPTRLSTGTPLASLKSASCPITLAWVILPPL